MVSENYLPTESPSNLQEKNQEAKVEKYDILEMLWFCIMVKYNQWFNAKQIQETKSNLSEEEINNFLLRAANRGFFDYACKGNEYEFKTAVTFNNIIG